MLDLDSKRMISVFKMIGDKESSSMHLLTNENNVE